MRKVILSAVAALLLSSPSYAMDDYGFKSITTGTFCKAITRMEATAAIRLSNTWTGTATWQASVTRVTPETPTAVWGMSLATRAIAQTTTTNGLYLIPVSGYSQVCVNFAPGSGTMDVFIDLTEAALNDALASSVASASQQSLAITGNAAILVTDPGTWTIIHEPAVATQATIAKGAGAAGVRHVLKSYAATLTCNGTAGTPLFFRIRDGACGAGTIVWTASVGCPVNGAALLVSPPGLTIVGTAATAMCAEFSGAGAAATQETVSAAGYDSN